MATASPTDVQPEPKKSLFDKVGPAIAVGLTALSAVFGSMSAAQLQQAMYWKSQAAQDQSKSTNQWSLAGFKRDRSMMMQTAAAGLRVQSQYRPPVFPPPKEPNSPEARALGWLTEAKGEKAGPPRVNLPDIPDEQIVALRKAIREREPEAELLAKASKVNKEAINKAIDDAEKAVEQIDVEWDPVVKAAAALVQAQKNIKPDASDEERMKKTLNAAAAEAAGFELEQRRYRAESFFNQEIAFLYEIRVKVSTATSDAARKKSEMLGYAMLVAQIGAVAASLALARKRGASLWLVAGFIGFIALGFGGYALIPASILAF